MPSSLINLVGEGSYLSQSYTRTENRYPGEHAVDFRCLNITSGLPIPVISEVLVNNNDDLGLLWR
jgi:hypothetical protein